MDMVREAQQAPDPCNALTQLERLLTYLVAMGLADRAVLLWGRARRGAPHRG